MTEQLIEAIKIKHESEKDSSHDLIDRINKIREDWFENMGVILTIDNKLTFNKPSSELIDSYKKWSFQKALENGKVVDINETTNR
jgi:hypothetical protein